MSVPMWRVTSKKGGIFRLMRCSAIWRCPVLDMGSHSVMPWIMLRIMVCRGSMWVSPFLVERFVVVVYLGAGVRVVLECYLVAFCVVDYDVGECGAD